MAAASESSGFDAWMQSHRLALLLLIISSVAMVAYAMVNDGFYQGEEGAHYINMKEFWEQPSKVLGNWAKTGWKILFVVPGLLGKKAVLVLSVLISMATAWVSFLYLRHQGSRFPLLAIVLLMTQTFWFGLSFRPICEPTAAFFLILACYLYRKNQLLWSALALSYALTIRQEMYIPGFFFGLFLLYNRQFLAAFALATFPLLYNVFGWISTGDPLYLFSNAFKAADFANKYMRPGFDHYLLMSPLVFGFIGILALAAFWGLVLSRKLKADAIILTPMLIYWLMECLYSMKAYPIGASTAGNLRYLLVISPLVAVAGARALDHLFDAPDRKWVWIIWVPVLALMARFCTYEHNFLEYASFRPHRYYLIVPALLFAISFLFRFRSKMSYFLSLGACCILSLIIAHQPLRLANRDENSTCKEIADWCKKFKYHETRSIYQSMPMFAYFYDRTPAQFPKGLQLITKESVERSPVGSIIIWDSHYAANYGPVNYTYFEERPEKFLPKLQTYSPDSTVAFIIYERINQ